LRTEEEILAEIEQAQKEYERAEAAFTHSFRDHIDPIQEVSDNPSPEMIQAQERLQVARGYLEQLRDEYEFFLANQPGSQEQ
jgi:hypothetical protein